MMNERINLSLELVIETLVSCGLKRIDAEVYTFLAKNGPHRGKDIARALKINKQQIYPALKNLKEKGIIKFTTKRPVFYFAEPMDKVLTMFMESRKKEIQSLKQKKEKLLSSWQANHE